jgi:NifB/MoaA-like Fe-S oxidoreductase
VVGNAVEIAFQPLVKQLNEVENLTVDLVSLRSEYWGQEISVTGLLTGEDLIRNLGEKDLGDGLLLPSVMLKYDDRRFLDDLTVEEVGNKLNIKIYPVNGIEELLKTCIRNP